MDELTPAMLSLAEIHRVLQGLLAEQVPINDLTRIYEALTLRAKVATDPESLVEAARGALGPALVARFADGGHLPVITIEPSLEQSLVQDLRPAEGGTQLVVDPGRLDAIFGSLSAAVAAAESAGKSPVLVCAPVLRPALRKLVPLPPRGVPVLSYAEVTSAETSVSRRSGWSALVPQFLLEGRSLEELTREATELYGAEARIVRADRVLDPGVAGFLGRRHLEVMVEVSDTHDGEPSPGGSGGATGRAHPGTRAHALSDRAGILALLETPTATRTTSTPTSSTAALRWPSHRTCPPSRQS